MYCNVVTFIKLLCLACRSCGSWNGYFEKLLVDVVVWIHYMSIFTIKYISYSVTLVDIHRLYNLHVLTWFYWHVEGGSSTQRIWFYFVSVLLRSWVCNLPIQSHLIIYISVFFFCLVKAVRLCWFSLPCIMRNTSRAE